MLRLSINNREPCMNLSKKSVLAAVLATLAFGPALADKGGGHGGRGHDDVRVERHDDRGGNRHGGDRRADRGHRRGHDDRVVRLDPHRRADRACPPGLVERRDACVPRGHARRAVVGHALPPGAVFVVPQRVRSTLPPPPAGYRYAVVDNQVVLVSNRNLVVDIVIRSLIG
jgi:Ni/Co efflux regulator RcnB